MCARVCVPPCRTMRKPVSLQLRAVTSIIRNQRCRIKIEQHFVPRNTESVYQYKLIRPPFSRIVNSLAVVTRFLANAYVCTSRLNRGKYPLRVRSDWRRPAQASSPTERCRRFVLSLRDSYVHVLMRLTVRRIYGVRKKRITFAYQFLLHIKVHQRR